jgi:hypothetical protein
MFVLVEHTITDPPAFWSAVEHSLPHLPSYLTLHHCFPTPDGTHAVCVWGAERLEDVRAFLESYVGHVCENVYYPVENAASIAAPSALAPAGHAAG